MKSQFFYLLLTTCMLLFMGQGYAENHPPMDNDGMGGCPLAPEQCECIESACPHEDGKGPDPECFISAAPECGVPADMMDMGPGPDGDMGPGPDGGMGPGPDGGMGPDSHGDMGAEIEACFQENPGDKEQCCPPGDDVCMNTDW